MAGSPLIAAADCVELVLVEHHAMCSIKLGRWTSLLILPYLGDPFISSLC